MSVKAVPPELAMRIAGTLRALDEGANAGEIIAIDLGSEDDIASLLGAWMNLAHLTVRIIADASGASVSDVVGDWVSMHATGYYEQHPGTREP